MIRIGARRQSRIKKPKKGKKKDEKKGKSDDEDADNKEQEYIATSTRKMREFFVFLIGELHLIFVTIQSSQMSDWDRSFLHSQVVWSSHGGPAVPDLPAGMQSVHHNAPDKTPTDLSVALLLVVQASLFWCLLLLVVRSD